MALDHLWGAGRPKTANVSTWEDGRACCVLALVLAIVFALVLAIVLASVLAIVLTPVSLCWPLYRPLYLLLFWPLYLLLYCTVLAIVLPSVLAIVLTPVQRNRAVSVLGNRCTVKLISLKQQGPQPSLPPRQGGVTHMF